MAARLVRHNLPFLSLGPLFSGREQELLDLAADLDAAGSVLILALLG